MAAPDSDIEWDDDVQWDSAPAPVASPEPVPGDEPGRKIGEPTARERRWGQIVSFMSGSPLFNTVAKASDALTGQRSAQSAQRATDQFSPKVAGVPLLPLAGSIAATAPAGAARVGGTLGGIALNTPRASMAARVGLQGGIGAATAADRGESVAVGTGAGLAGGVIGEGVGYGLTKAAEAAQPALTKFANEQAVKALLGGGTMVNRLKNKLGVGSDVQLQSLGADVRGLGVLNAGPIPRSAQGISEAVQGRMASEGAEIGRIRELADAMVASGKASPPDALALAQAYERGVTGAASIANETAVAPKVLRQSKLLLEQAAPAPGGIPTTQGGTFKGMWDQTSAMQKSAFSPLAPPVKQEAALSLQKAGVQSARGELAKQMEGAVGPDEMRNLSEAMKRYSTAARISDTVEDTAGRSVARSPISLGDHQLAQTIGATGPVGLGVAGLSSLVRGRGNAAAATYAPALGAVASPALGLAGGVSRFAAPAVARQSVADPMGPLRQYLGLSREERNEANAQAFEDSP